MSDNNNKKKYEVANYVSDDRDFISAAPIKELPGGQTYISLDALDEIVEKQLDKRLGAFRKNE